MTQTFDIQNMGLVSLESDEMYLINGGGFWEWLLGAGTVLLVAGLIISSGGLAIAGLGIMGAGAIGMADNP